MSCVYNITPRVTTKLQRDLLKNIIDISNGIIKIKATHRKAKKITRGTINGTNTKNKS